MSLLAAALVFGAGLTAPIVARDVRAGWRRFAGRRQRPAPYRPDDPTPAQIAEWEQDDCLPADDLWCAFYPPGSLGEHPETPGRPGPLAAGPGDVEDLLTGANRLLRAGADDSGAWRIVAE